MEIWISWLIVLAALIHIGEEYVGGWLNWAQGYIKGVTLLQFVVVNVLFVGLCVASAFSGSVLFRLTIAGLVFVNALVHVVPTVVRRRCAPGVWSAVLLYVPLSVLAFHVTWTRGLLTPRLAALALVLGSGLMAMPFVAQLLRVYVSRKHGPSGQRDHTRSTIDPKSGSKSRL